MFKTFLIAIITVLNLNLAIAQKADTIVYYLKNDGKVVSAKDSADFFLVILPPDTSIDKTLYRVNEFYSNGKKRLIGNSKTNNLDLKFQGSVITFFYNGHRMRITNYENGAPIGDETEYYPNGKPYNIKSYTANGDTILKHFQDSVGKVGTDNGKGKWIEFLNERFDEFYLTGNVINGLKEGIWEGKINDASILVSVYKRGSLAYSNYKEYGVRIHTKVDIKPEFPGGYKGFGSFISHNIKYPARARENGTKGNVIVDFVVEKDGSIDNIKVTKGIGDGCDEECLRIMKACPPWKPGYLSGIPIAVNCSYSISFTLIDN